MDLDILIWIDNNLHSNEAVSQVIKYITYLGETGWIWIALCVVLLIFKRTRYIGVTLAVALILDFLLVNVALKNIVNRARPWTEYESFKQFYDSISLKLPTDSSFPSGHAGISFAAAVALIIRVRKWSIPAVILAVLIALSRLYLCVHYPTDVLVGAIVGSACGVLGCVIVSAIRKKIAKKE